MSATHTALLGALCIAGCLYSVDPTKVSSTGGGADAGNPSDTGTASGGDSSPGETKDGGAIEGPTDGLIGYWAFDDEDTGTAVRDRSGGGHGGVLDGTIVRDDGAPGHGRGISTNANAELGLGRFHVPSLDGTSFPAHGTLSLWFRVRHLVLENEPANSVNAFFDVNNSFRGRSGSYFSMGFGAYNTSVPDGLVVGIIRAGTSAVPEHATISNPVRGQWNHLVAVWDGATLSLYNGPAGQKVVIGDTQSYTSFVPFDQRVIFMERLIGDLDEVRLYNRALAAQEVEAIP